jgi:hypothetical protein
MFFILFSYNLPVGTLSSVLKFNFLLKFCVNFLFCNHYFSPLNTFLRKGKDPGSGSPTLLAGSRLRIKLIKKNYRDRPERCRIRRAHIFCLTVFYSMAGMFFAGEAGADAE